MSEPKASNPFGLYWSFHDIGVFLREDLGCLAANFSIMVCIYSQQTSAVIVWPDYKKAVVNDIGTSPPNAHKLTWGRIRLVRQGSAIAMSVSDYRTGFTFHYRFLLFIRFRTPSILCRQSKVITQQSTRVCRLAGAQCRRFKAFSPP